jgi:Circularly permutated YpsA SLOG family
VSTTRLKGGWAEDLPNPPGLLAKYPKLRETPQSNPLQRTEWNVRDSDAALIITDGGGMAVSVGTDAPIDGRTGTGSPSSSLTQQMRKRLRKLPRGSAHSANASARI